MKRKVMVVSLMIAISSTAVAANTCDSITEINALSVSYTHLTLPTIYSV